MSLDFLPFSLATFDGSKYSLTLLLNDYPGLIPMAIRIYKIV